MPHTITTSAASPSACTQPRPARNSPPLTTRGAEANAPPADPPPPPPARGVGDRRHGGQRPARERHAGEPRRAGEEHAGEPRDERHEQERQDPGHFSPGPG